MINNILWVLDYMKLKNLNIKIKKNLKIKLIFTIKMRKLSHKNLNKKNLNLTKKIKNIYWP